MTDKTLTDELRGTFVAHSLDAPQPQSSIEAILARTVPSAVDAAPTADTPPSRLSGARRWHTSRVLAVAAAIAVVGGVAATIKDLRSTVSKSSGSAFSSGVAGTSGGQANSERLPATGADATAQPPLRATPAAGGADAQAGSAPNPLGCPSGGVASSILASLDMSGRHESVESIRCTTTGSDRVGGEILRVVRADTTGSTVVTTLVTGSQGLHVLSVQIATGVIVVRATDWAGPPAPDRGALTEYRYRVSSDATMFTLARVTPLALSCRAASLAFSVTGTGTNAGGDSASAVLVARNTGTRACVLEGAPGLSVRPDVAAGGTSARGARPAQILPPISRATPVDSHRIAIVTVQPGQSASLPMPGGLITPGPRDCTSPSRVTVTLPASGDQASLSTPVAVCILQVGAFVVGSTGS
jgi:hypothetical protein